MNAQEFTDIEILLAGIMCRCAKDNDAVAFEIAVEGIDFLTTLQNEEKDKEEIRKAFENGTNKLKAIAAHAREVTTVILVNANKENN